MTAKVLNVVGKVRVMQVVKPVVHDLTNPDTIRVIWDEANKALRADRTRRVRRQRMRKLLKI